MTNPYQPQQPQYAPQQPYAQPQYGQPPAPQYGQPPAYAPQQPYAQPQYGQPPVPQYQPQYGGYAPQQPQYQPEPAVPATLGDFFNQPSSGWGPSVTPTAKTPDGTQVLMVVAQWITEAHVEHKDEYNKPGVKAYRGGRPVYVMKLPVQVAPGTQYMAAQGVQVVEADGRATFYVQGGTKDLLGAAIANGGGNPGEPPEQGSIILATKTHNRRNNQGTESSVMTFQYWRRGPEAQAMAAQYGITYPSLDVPKPVTDNGSGGNTGGNIAPAPVSAGPTAQQQAAAPQPVTQFPASPAPVPAQPPVGMPGVPTAGLTPPAPAPGTYATAPGQAPAAPVLQPPAQQMPQPPAAVPGMGQVPSDPAKQELLARLTGQQPAAAPASVA